MTVLLIRYTLSSLYNASHTTSSLYNASHTVKKVKLYFRSSNRVAIKECKSLDFLSEEPMRQHTLDAMHGGETMLPHQSRPAS